MATSPAGPRFYWRYCSFVDAGVLRDVLARAPGAVAIVSAPAPDGLRGMAASAFIALSLDPPLIGVAAQRPSATAEAAVESGAIAISLLERSQEFLADRFAGRAPAVDGRWTGVPHRLAASGAPIVERAVAWFDCRVERRVETGDHDLLVARVEGAGTAEGEPLIHWDRGFWRLC